MVTNLAIVATLAVSSYSLAVHACGLEPAVKGGLTVSYPGALDVAVAVAQSRGAGILPPADPSGLSNEAQLQQMLADLRRLQTRLNAGLEQRWHKDSAAFALVLVGPGLWSHYHPNGNGITGEYHTAGPLEGEVVVLTHHSVLRALLNGRLTTDRATRLGLLAFSGDQASSVRRVFESGLFSSV